MCFTFPNSISSNLDIPLCWMLLLCRPYLNVEKLIFIYTRISWNKSGTRGFNFCRLANVNSLRAMKKKYEEEEKRVFPLENCLRAHVNDFTSFSYWMNFDIWQSIAPLMEESTPWRSFSRSKSSNNQERERDELARVWYISPFERAEWTGSTRLHAGPIQIQIPLDKKGESKENTTGPPKRRRRKIFKSREKRAAAAAGAK